MTAYRVFMKAAMANHTSYHAALDKWRVLKSSFAEREKAGLEKKGPIAKAPDIVREVRIKWYAYCESLVRKTPYVDAGEFM